MVIAGSDKVRLRETNSHMRDIDLTGHRSCRQHFLQNRGVGGLRNKSGLCWRRIWAYRMDISCCAGSCEFERGRMLGRKGGIGFLAATRRVNWLADIPPNAPAAWDQLAPEVVLQPSLHPPVLLIFSPVPCRPRLRRSISNISALGRVHNRRAVYRSNVERRDQN